VNIRFEAVGEPEKSNGFSLKVQMAKPQRQCEVNTANVQISFDFPFGFPSKTNRQQVPIRFISPAHVSAIDRTIKQSERCEYK
jgi:hypothetical protein